MKVADLASSTAFRLAATFSLLFALTLIALFGILYLQIGRELEGRLTARLVESRAQHTRVDQRDGFNELAGLIADEAYASQDREDIFLLDGAEGDYIAGNIRSATRFTGTQWIGEEQISVTSSEAGGPLAERYLASWMPVSGGALLVGLGDSEIRNTRAVMLRALLWGLGGGLLLATAAGAFLGHRAQRRIDDVAHTLTAIRGGELSARVPIAGWGGDIDVVSAQINEALDRLQHLFVSVNQSSADIAHDLKTPIGRLRQRLEALRDDPVGGEAVRVRIEAAIEEIDGIVDTFEGLLNITQIEAGARKSRFKSVLLSDVAAGMVEAYQAVAEDASMTLDCELAPATSTAIKGDWDLLCRLLANLIENSIRHCPPGTRIKVKVVASVAGLDLVVSDSGPGIPADERDKVFRRLYRLEKSRTTPGSGLGLALVRAICDLHDARIDLADNQPGLLVRVCFPRPTPA